MEEITCQICEYSSELGNEGSCPYCGSTVTGDHPDQMLKKGTGSFWEGRKSTQAQFYLTDQRFIAIPLKYKGNNIKGALTATVLNKMSKGVQIHSIPLKEIKSVDHIRIGLLGKATMIYMKNGEEFKIQLYKQKVWREEIMKAIANIK